MGQLRSAIGDVFAYSATHDQKRTGDLISRVTDDIEAIQSFIITGLTGILINAMTVLLKSGVKRSRFSEFARVSCSFPGLPCSSR
jgi:ABC-type multidrug transport system fused ATPase/permease subunit